MSDTPANPFTSGCPKAKKAAKPASPNVGWTVALPHHRHVQLALKHTRLGKRSPYLENISEPGPIIRPKREALYPKIVNGRYIVLYTWTRTKSPGSLYQKDLEVLRACKHQCCWSSDNKKLQPLNPFHNFERTINAALREVGHEVLGTCHRCATDFSVRVDNSVMTAWIWKDLGSEGSPMEPAWRRLTGDYRLPSEDSKSEHKPGDIRALYT
ncbi:hypothetical protein NM208_g14147 [Fusarium decemcellulare]|uniref:Uncharacterized protein n=1 Tax=Fusarium decemcellulare TaxID=57161 RepID=A0ACC1RJ17_9HYPO|nr:hypothetical protein NM208_g14147 [Fusarium decemcellulare]